MDRVAPASRGTLSAVRTVGWSWVAGVALSVAAVTAGCAFEPPRAGIGEVCRRDRDCQDGLACLAHECVRRGGGGDSEIDAGRPRDAGPRPPDAGPRDAGAPPVDTGPVDAGPTMDAGPADAGPTDAALLDVALPDAPIARDTGP